jgi:hypothetical protein
MRSSLVLGSFLLLLLLLLLAASAAFAQCETLTYQTEVLPQFTVGSPAHFDVEAVGGTPPYTFTVIDGAFPAGMRMNSKGKIRGVPTEVADVTVLILLTDANGCTLGQAFPVRVDVAP